MTETEEDTLHSEANPRDIKFKRVIQKTTIEIKVTTYDKGSEVNPDPPPEDLEFHQSLPAGIMTDISTLDSVDILPKTVLRRSLLQAEFIMEEKE